MSTADVLRNPHLRELRPYLDETGLPWKAVTGKKHLKVFIAGRLATVLSHGGRLRASSPTDLKNSRASIRRLVETLR